MKKLITALALAFTLSACCPQMDGHAAKDGMNCQCNHAKEAGKDEDKQCDCSCCAKGMKEGEMCDHSKAAMSPKK